MEQGASGPIRYSISPGALPDTRATEGQLSTAEFPGTGISIAVNARLAKALVTRWFSGPHPAPCFVHPTFLFDATV